MNDRTLLCARSTGRIQWTTLLLLLSPSVVVGCVPDLSIDGDVVSAGSTTSEEVVDTGGAQGSTSAATSAASSESGAASEEGSSGDETSEAGTSSSGGDNNAPEALDDALFGTQDQPAIAAPVRGLLANDTDPDGDPLEVVAFDRASASGGTVFVGAGGSAQYTPVPGYWGRDGFGYTVQDEHGAEASAEVTVHVAPEHVSLGQLDGESRGFVINGEVENSNAGASLAPAGDINGDGRSDLLIGTFGYEMLEGRSYVVFGKPDHAPVELSDVADGEGGFVLNPELGASSSVDVNRAGDVNGDGLADLLVISSSSQSPFHRAYIVFGKPDSTAVDLSDVAAGVGGFAINPEQAGGSLPISSGAGAGDVNGDGLDDIVVGSATAYSDVGRAYVIFGKADADTVELSAVAAGSGGFSIDGEQAESETGASVAGLGDVDSDGLDDLFIGAPRVDGSNGRAYVVFGKADTTSIELASVHAGNGGFSLVASEGILLTGRSVTGLEDFNGDGVPDMLIHAVFQTLVVFGKADTASVDLATLAEEGLGLEITSESDATFSRSVGVGDINADGRGDVLLSASQLDTDGGERSGRGYVVYGSDTAGPIEMSDLLTGEGGWVMDGAVPFAHAGSQVSPAGDVDGDGVDDLMIAATLADPNGSNSGQVYVVFGVPTQ